MLQVILDNDYIVNLLKKAGRYDWFMEEMARTIEGRKVNRVMFGENVDERNGFLIVYYFGFPDEKDNGFTAIMMIDGSEADAEMFEIAVEGMKRGF